MPSEQSPIIFREHLQLTNLGIRQPEFTSDNVTMESDKNIVVREMINDQQQVVIIEDPTNPDDPPNPTRLPISADSIIMHPTVKILALKSGKTLQIFHIKLKAIVKEHQNAEDIVFWKWINETTIALVSETAVYHWSIECDAVPVKIFDRHLSGTSQITNYHTDADSKWLVLIGISATDNRGNMQLYNTETKVSQSIEGNAACFVRYTLEGNLLPSNLLCFSVKNEAGGNLQIIEVGSSAAGNQAFQKKRVDVPYTAEESPVSIQVSSKPGVIYLITKHGFVHLYDIESGGHIYSNRILKDIVFVTCKLSKTDGIMGITRKGQVFSVSIFERYLVPFVTNTLQNPDLALNLAIRGNFPGVEDLFVPMFNLGESSSNLLKNHTPRSIHELSKSCCRFGNYRTACGLMWVCALVTLQKFISDNSLNVSLHSDNSSNFAYTISREIGRLFCNFELCQNAYYANEHCHSYQKSASELAEEFIEKLEEFVLCDKKREELENPNFD